MEIRIAVSDGLQKSIFADILGEGARLRLLFAQGDHLYMRAVMMMVVYACLCGYVFALYAMAKFLYPRQHAMALFTPVIGLLMIPAFISNGLYLYDFAVLFLTSACYYCMVRQRWWQYLFWFLLACLNKETAIFICVFYALWNWHRVDAWTFRVLALLQGLIYLGVRLWLMARFMNNPGVVLEYHYPRQLHALLTGYNFHILAADFFMIFLVLWRWHRKPAFARYILAIFPFMLLAYLIFGYPGEYRVFYDLFPLLTVLVADTLVMGTDLSRFAIFNRDDTHVSSSLDQAASA